MNLIKRNILLSTALLCCLAASAQHFRKPFPPGNGFGIPFTRPDTVTSLKAFEQNDTTRFVSPSELEQLRKDYVGDGTFFEKQSIRDEQNLFVCFRYKEDGIWFRYTFWIRLLNDGRPAFRQRVYVDPDLNDKNDANDLLVFQADYQVFELFNPYFSSDKPESLEGTAVFSYLENLLAYTCQFDVRTWLALGYPELDQVRGHSTGVRGSTFPVLNGNMSHQRSFNPLHEIYLGVNDKSGEHSSLYFLCYPIGDVKALFMTGSIWTSYHQFARTKRPFKLEVSEKVTDIGEGDYFIGLNGMEKIYDEVDHSLYFQTSYINGFQHGIQLWNMHTVQDSLREVRFNFFVYGEQINENRTVFTKDLKDVHDYENDLYVDFASGAKSINKACRRYKRHCRKWKIISE